VPRCVAGFILIGLIAAAGCDSRSSKPEAAAPTTTSTAAETKTEPLQGTVELHGRHGSVVSIDGQDGSECGTPRVLQLQSGNSTEGIYDSWKEGADVIVRDERGSIIGTDILTSGIATAMDGDTVTTCVFTFFGRCADRREELSGRGR
jgi:hypothetical protein